jgi:hypothetical protein
VSFLAAVLTGIYLCNASSCREMLRRNGRGQARADAALEQQLELAVRFCQLSGAVSSVERGYFVRPDAADR